jgi:signal peptidase II
MSIGETIPVFGKWFLLHFVENKGMAFGVVLGGVAGKIALTLFRVIAVGALSYFIHLQIRKGMPLGFILALGLITAGAAGNIIDSAIYGLIFNESTYANAMIPGSGVAEFLPAGGGYAPFLQGSVVDMLYFPVIDTTWPHWVPVVGGQSFTFFRPIFNVADSAITCGVFWVLIFHRKSLRAM